VNNRRHFSLYEVTNRIHDVVNQVFKNQFWVKAEINKLNFHKSSGHAYPELVEKQQDRIVAEMRASIFRQDFQRIQRNFESILKEPLKDGITVLLLAQINFHPIYGLSLTISDIDPAFTLGELERERLETMSTLKQWGIFDLNKQKTLPLLPKRIAVISMENSKGYSDFMQVLNHNQWHYSFYTHLFPATLQGDKAITTIIAQLNRIKKVLHHFDAVAIIRGGGGEVGMSCFNNLSLTKAIAEFPLPIFTGIGHSTNETVAEIISFKNAITPTQLADFFIQRFHDFAVPLQKLTEKTLKLSIEMIRFQHKELNYLAGSFKSSTQILIQSHRFKNTQIGIGLKNANKHSIFNQHQKLQSQIQILSNQSKWALLIYHQSLIKQNNQLMIVLKSLNLFKQELLQMEKSVELLNPANLLKRGYSFATINGALIQSISQLKQGDLIESHFADGTAKSIIESKEKYER
jgi:exodeoxyribonuclease VII large subunit